MWDGRFREELGDLLTAQDIYEEVLANKPPLRPRWTSRSSRCSSRSIRFRFNILLKQDKVYEVVEEAGQWVKDYKRLERTPGFQGIVLQLAKGLIAQAEKARGRRRACLRMPERCWTMRPRSSLRK